MHLCRLIAEFISLITSRMKRRKYVASGVIIREVDRSDTIPAHRAVQYVRSQAEMEALFGKAQCERDKVSIE